jgi:IS4 transposase
MLLGDVFERFVQRSPLTVMVRGILENLLRPDKLDTLFAETANLQYTRKLLFSSLVDLMGLVVCKVRPSIHAAFASRKEAIGASLTAVYGKLNHLEPATAAAMVRCTAQDAAAVIDALGGRLPEWLPGYTVRIVDGNRLTGTEHRLQELRRTKQGALPGQSLVVFDPVRGVATDVVPGEDAHAQERSLLEGVIAVIRERDLWIADRNFCTARLVFAVAARAACFIVRHHRGSFAWEPVGKQRRAGRTETGTVFGQTVRVEHDGTTRLLRRITVVLDEPTQDGDRELHLLTNLPVEDAAPGQVAELYRRRWTIEGVFQDLTQTLRCAINTLGYPKAALFGFCTALVAFNALAVAKAALRSVHGVEKVAKEVSDYHLAAEVAAVYEGLDIAVPAADWAAFHDRTPQALSRVLKQLAHRVELNRFRKHKRGPKKPRPKRQSGAGSTHVSTARLLATRKTAARSP